MIDNGTLNVGVPCGKCPNCVKRRASGWSFRLMQEEKQSLSAHFITMTYDTNYVPITRNGFMQLSRRDIQLFFKRLRKNIEEKGQVEKPVKYYAVGEYGGRTMRPHYHIILFNAWPEVVEASWKLGAVHYGSVTGASIGYSLKYMCKRGRIPLHKNDDRQPEFALMSKRLGIGYVQPVIINWHKECLDERVYCNIDGGRKISMPRYYKDKIYTEMERKRIAYFVGAKMRYRLEEEFMNETALDMENKVAGQMSQFRKMHKSAISNNKI